MGETILRDYITIETLFIPLVIGVFIIILVLRLTADKAFVLSVIEKKKKKATFIDFLLKELASMDESLFKLENDVKVLDKFNLTHLKPLKNHTEKIMYLNNYSNVLENENISKAVEEYATQARVLVEDITFLEENLYNVKSSYEVYLEDAKHRNRMGEITRDEFLAEVNLQRDKIVQFINETSASRHTILHRIVVLRTEKNEVENAISRYVKNEIKAKRFYIRHVAFI